MLTTFILGPHLCKTNISRCIKVEQFHSAHLSTRSASSAKTSRCRAPSAQFYVRLFFFFFLEEA